MFRYLTSDLGRFSREAGLTVPSHFFTVVTRCQEPNRTVEECGDGLLDVFSFLLPHREDNTEACNVSGGRRSLQQGQLQPLLNS